MKRLTYNQSGQVTTRPTKKRGPVMSPKTTAAVMRVVAGTMMVPLAAMFKFMMKQQHSSEKRFFALMDNMQKQNEAIVKLVEAQSQPRGLGVRGWYFRLVMLAWLSPFLITGVTAGAVWWFVNHHDRGGGGGGGQGPGRNPEAQRLIQTIENYRGRYRALQMRAAMLPHSRVPKALKDFHFSDALADSVIAELGGNPSQQTLTECRIGLVSYGDQLSKAESLLDSAANGMTR